MIRWSEFIDKVFKAVEFFFKYFWVISSLSIIWRTMYGCKNILGFYKMNCVYFFWGNNEVEGLKSRAWNNDVVN